MKLQELLEILTEIQQSKGDLEVRISRCSTCSRYDYEPLETDDIKISAEGELSIG